MNELKHICEVCGVEELLTPEAGFDAGWDYPPRMGMFRIVSQRTCPDCPIDKTVWWALTVEKKKLSDLNEAQLLVVNRILNEPESIVKGK